MSKTVFFNLVFALLIVSTVWRLISGIGHTRARERKRSEAFMAGALSRGWTYTARDDQYATRWTGDPFGEGFDRRFTNVMSGSIAGRSVVAFDYSFKTKAKNNSKNGSTTTHRSSVIALSVGCWFPDLEVTPENSLTRIAGRVRGNDIHLEAEDFNRAFTVTCSNRQFASDLLHPRLMESLVAHGADVNWRFAGTDLLAMRYQRLGSSRNDLASIDQQLAVMEMVLAAIPDFVWKKTAENQPAPSVLPEVVTQALYRWLT